MKKLSEGGRIRLSGGYDYIPKWLPGGSGFDATVLRFIENNIEGRTGDNRLSAIIEFDDVIEFDGMKGKHGMIMGRWEGQTWEPDGVVHVHLIKNEIERITDLPKGDSKWMESHASYKTIEAKQNGVDNPSNAHE